MARKYFIETFGCQMNYHDSERLAGLLEADGYEPRRRRARRPTSSSSTPAACASGPKTSCTRGSARFARRRAETRRRRRSSPSPAASRSRKASALLKRDRPIDVVVGTQSLKQLPRLVAEARERRRAAIDINPHDDVSFPLGVARHVGSRARLGDDHRRLQRVLRVLRGAVHARARAHAAGRRHPGRGATRPPTPAASRCSCSGRSSITTRRRTIRRATSPRCSSA